MYERLYQPDFSAVFSEKFANAFWYPMTDSLIWPLFGGMKLSTQTKNLLSLVGKGEYPLFYRRKIAQDDYFLEQSSCGVEIGLIQAMELNREYGIPNSDVEKVLKAQKGKFYGIFSVNLIDDERYNENLAQFNLSTSKNAWPAL